MVTVLVACSVAAALTAVFAFRFRAWKTPKKLVAYFSFFFLLELAADYLVLPPGLLGIELAAVCFGIAALFVGAILATRHLELDDPDEP